MEEQLKAVRYLDTETAKFDTLTADAQRAIDLLQERRTALLSAFFTGQIDVRGLAVAQATEGRLADSTVGPPARRRGRAGKG